MFRKAAVTALLALPPSALACGVCVEDKIAASYDHAVITEAAARGHVVVFAEVQGSGPAAARVAAATRAARRVPGIVRSSVRGAESPAALSFALDTSRRSPRDALVAVEKAAAASGVRLAILRVMR